MQALVIRRAESAEAAFLSALAFRSKAHWGYDQAFLDACVAPLTITGDRIETSPVYVGAVGSQVVGFYGLGALDDEADLAFLFVEPAATGRGYGWQLWRHAAETARSLGFQRLRVEADPNAEPFYRAMGAERIGEAPSTAVADRMLPLLLYRLEQVDVARD